MLSFSIPLIIVLSNAVSCDAAPALGLGVPFDTATEVMATLTVAPTSNQRTLDPTIDTSTSTGTSSAPTSSAPNTTSPVSVDPTLDSTTLALTTARPTTSPPNSSSPTTSAPTTSSLTTVETSTSGSTVTSIPSTLDPTTVGKTTYPKTTPYTSTSVPTTSVLRTHVSTTLPPTVVPPKGDIYVTLVVYCGLHDPGWTIDPSTNNYQKIRGLLREARNGLFTYDHICMPRKTGYKGFLVVEEVGEELVVGTETILLQKELLYSMPVDLAPTDEFLDHVRNEIDSSPSKECSTSRLRKRYAPPYRPGRWNGNLNIRRNNNCYNYANTIRTDTFAQPGRGSGQIYGRITNREIRDAAVRDGMVVLNIAPGAPVPQAPNGDPHLVALVVHTKEIDFHWYRLDNTGEWSHKPGQTGVTNLDNSMRRITDPRTADIGSYTFVCFMTTDRTTVRIR